MNEQKERLTKRMMGIFKNALHWLAQYPEDCKLEQYYILCLKCDEILNIVEESCRGEWLKSSTKKELPHFVIKHLGHELKILDEFDIEEIENDN